MAKSKSHNRNLRSRKRSSRGRSKKKMSRNSRRCKNLLKKKVEKNLKEYVKGKYSSRSQAIAVSYSQVKKMSPSCSKVFRRKSRK